MNIIIDTNIWISFLIGHQTQLVRKILTDTRFDVYVCPQLIEEIRNVASRTKIAKYLKPDDLTELLEIINVFCHTATTSAGVPYSAARDPKDLYLLSLAETIEADYIVSGDADLTDISPYKQTRVIKLAEFKHMMFG